MKDLIGIPLPRYMYFSLATQVSPGLAIDPAHVTLAVGQQTTNTVMFCLRCHGLLVVDHFIDMQDGGKHHWLRVWRCLNCGEVAEPGIIRHRLGQRSLFASLVKRCVRTSGKKYEVIPLGV